MSAVQHRGIYCVLACFLLASSSLCAEDIRLTVIHSNDVSGQLTRRSGRGGMAARVGLIRKLQISEPAIVLDAGNALGPNAMSRFDAGATMCAAMKSREIRCYGGGKSRFVFGLGCFGRAAKRNRFSNAGGESRAKRWWDASFAGLYHGQGWRCSGGDHRCGGSAGCT